MDILNHRGITLSEDINIRDTNYSMKLLIFNEFAVGQFQTVKFSSELALDLFSNATALTNLWWL